MFVTAHPLTPTLHGVARRPIGKPSADPIYKSFLWCHCRIFSGVSYDISWYLMIWVKLWVTPSYSHDFAASFPRWRPEVDYSGKLAVRSSVKLGEWHRELHRQCQGWCYGASPRAWGEPSSFSGSNKRGFWWVLRLAAAELYIWDLVPCAPALEVQKIKKIQEIEYKYKFLIWLVFR